MDIPIPRTIEAESSLHAQSRIITRVFTFTDACTFALSRVHVKDHRRTRKSGFTCTQATRPHTHMRKVHRGISYSGCQIDLVYLNRYPVPLSLKIREKERARERRVPVDTALNFPPASRGEEGCLLKTRQFIT